MCNNLTMNTNTVLFSIKKICRVVSFEGKIKKGERKTKQGITLWRPDVSFERYCRLFLVGHSYWWTLSLIFGTWYTSISIVWQIYLYIAGCTDTIEYNISSFRLPFDLDPSRHMTDYIHCNFAKQFPFWERRFLDRHGQQRTAETE